MKRFIALGLTLVAVFIVTPASLAHEVTFDDPQGDVERGPFDIQSNAMAHERMEGARHVIHEVTMFDAWDSEELATGYVTLGFDSKRGRHNEGFVTARMAEDGSVYAPYYRS